LYEAGFLSAWTAINPFDLRKHALHTLLPSGFDSFHGTIKSRVLFADDPLSGEYKPMKSEYWGIY
jgi:hypothetical protein